MPNSQPRQQRGYPPQQQYPPYAHPPVGQQQMHPPPPPMHEGYSHQPPPGYAPPPGTPGYAPPPGAPPHYHPGYAYGYPPAGYSPPFYPPVGSSPPQYGYPQPGHPNQMNPPTNNSGRPYENKSSSPPKTDKSPNKTEKKLNDVGNSDSLVKSSTNPINKSPGAPAETDDMISRVGPMRSDFHFYAEQFKKEALEKVGSENLNPLDTITALNERLVSMWESQSSSTRNEYMMKEELDRSRFMNEDEIESRHCATLTSRPRPYIHLKQDSVSKVVTKDEDEEQEKSAGTKRSGIQEEEAGAQAEEYESPTKKSRETSDAAEKKE